jgi:hypothetical protein
MRDLACLMLTLCMAAASHAAEQPEPARAPRCDAPALHAPDYQRAIDTVRRLPELVAWSRSHSFPVAYGESMDQQVALEGRCYWSVSVYANRPERLELWNVFFVEAKGKGLLVQDPESGEAVSLQEWRTSTVRS